MAVLSWPEPHFLLWSKGASALKELLRAPHVGSAWGEQSSGQLQVIEAYQARVPDLQMAEDLFLGMGWVLKWLLVFGERRLI